MILILLELAGATGYLFLVHLLLKSRGIDLIALLQQVVRRDVHGSVSPATSHPAKRVTVNIAQCRARPIGSRKDFAECLMGPFHPCEFAFGVGEVRFCCHPESKKIIAQTKTISVFHPQPTLNGKPHPAPAMLRATAPLVTEAAK